MELQEYVTYLLSLIPNIATVAFVVGNASCTEPLTFSGITKGRFSCITCLFIILHSTVEMQEPRSKIQSILLEIRSFCLTISTFFILISIAAIPIALFIHQFSLSESYLSLSCIFCLYQ